MTEELPKVLADWPRSRRLMQNPVDLLFLNDTLKHTHKIKSTMCMCFHNLVHVEREGNLMWFFVCLYILCLSLTLCVNVQHIRAVFGEKCNSLYQYV